MKKVLALMLCFAIGFTSICLDVRAAEAETESVLTETVDIEETSDVEEVEENVEESTNETEMEEEKSVETTVDAINAVEKSEIDETVEVAELTEVAEEVVENSWEIELNPNRNELYCGDKVGDSGDSINISVLAVGDNKFVSQKPSFSSSDTNIVTVKANKDDPKTATILAIGPGVATITIKFAGETKTQTIVVSHVDTFDGAEFVKSAITLKTSGSDKSAALQIALLPESLETDVEDIHVQYTYDDKLINLVKDKTDERKITVSVASTALENISDNNKTVITAEVKVGDAGQKPKIAICEITIDASIDDETIKKVNSYLVSNPVYAVPEFHQGKKTTLADIALPELPSDEYKNGTLSWVDGSLLVQADDDMPTQYFEAYFKQPQSEKVIVRVPVNVTTLNGIIAKADKKSMGINEECKVDASGKYLGYKLDSDAFVKVMKQYPDQVSFNISHGIGKQESNLKMSDALTTLSLEKTYSFKIDDASKTGAVKNWIKVDVKWGAKNYSSTVNVNAIYKTVVKDINFVNSDTGEKLTYIDYDYDDITEKNGIPVTVFAKSWDGNADVSDSTTIKWYSDNPSVASVVADRKNSNKAVITLKKKSGKALVYATAQDSAKCSKAIEINLKDYSPVMGDSKNPVIEVNYHKDTATKLGLHGQSGSTIEKVDFSTENPRESTFLEFKDLAENSEIRIDKWSRDRQNIPNRIKAKVNVSYRVNDEIKEEEIKFTINIVKRLPQVKVKVLQKANIATTNPVALYQITSDVPIQWIANETDSRGMNVNTGFSFWGGNYKGMYVGDFEVITHIPDAEIYKEMFTGAAAGKNKTVTLSVKLEGYWTFVKVKFTVDTYNERESLKMDNVVLLPGENSGTVKLYNNTRKENLDLDDVEIESLTNDVSFIKDTVQVVRKSKNIKTYKLQLKHNYYWNPYVLSGRFVDADNYTVQLDQKKVILNTAEHWNQTQNDRVTVNATVEDAGRYFDGKLTYSGADSITVGALKSGMLIVRTTDNSITVGLANIDSDSEIYKKYAGKTYKLKVAGKVTLSNEKKVDAKAAVLTIATTTKSPKVSIRTQGNVDLTHTIDFADSRPRGVMICKATVANTSSRIKDVELCGNDRGLFEFKAFEGFENEYLLSPSDPVKLTYSTKKNYNLTVRFTLQNGLTVDTPIKFKVKATTPDIKVVSPSSVKLNRSATTQSVVYGTTLSNREYMIWSGNVVSDISSDYFDVSIATASGKVTISLTEDGRKAKPGTYYVTAQYKMKGQPSSVKPITKKFKIIIE